MRQTRNIAKQDNAEPLASELPAPKRRRANRGPSIAESVTLEAETNMMPLPARSTQHRAPNSLLPQKQTDVEE